jgi:2-dehydropantoate 2-reductase
MRIAVLGAGGVGSYYGGMLARAGHRIVLLARGAHLDAIRGCGLEVRTPDETFTATVEATDDPQQLGAVDCAIIAVKNYSLPEVAPVARSLADKGADILPLLNGVEAADRLIAEGIPENRVLGGLTEISAVRTGPGVVERRSGFQRIVVGERNGGVSERAERISATFREAGVEARASEDITADLWRKLAFIATMAAVCGLARSSIGPIRKALSGIFSSRERSMKSPPSPWPAAWRWPRMWNRKSFPLSIHCPMRSSRASCSISNPEDRRRSTTCAVRSPGLDERSASKRRCTTWRRQRFLSDERAGRNAKKAARSPPCHES